MHEQEMTHNALISREFMVSICLYLTCTVSR